MPVGRREKILPAVGAIIAAAKGVTSHTVMKFFIFLFQSVEWSAK
jgi:hypothetical protein